MAHDSVWPSGDQAMVFADADLECEHLAHNGVATSSDVSSTESTNP